MKRNENRKNRNWRNFVVLTLVCMLAATLVGCKTSTAVTPEPSTSEVVSEPVSEPVSEEVSEPVSEEPSEEVVSEEVSEEPVEEVEIVNFSNAKELANYAKGLNKTTMIEYDFSEDGNSQAIIPNGAKYTLQFTNKLDVVSNKEILNIETSLDYISTSENPLIGTWLVFIDTTGTDLEVSFTVNYADGTSEDFTIYVTVE